MNEEEEAATAATENMVPIITEGNPNNGNAHNGNSNANTGTGTANSTANNPANSTANGNTPHLAATASTRRRNQHVTPQPIGGTNTGTNTGTSANTATATGNNTATGFVINAEANRRKANRRNPTSTLVTPKNRTGTRTSISNTAMSAETLLWKQRFENSQKTIAVTRKLLKRYGITDDTNPALIQQLFATQDEEDATNTATNATENNGNTATTTTIIVNNTNNNTISAGNGTGNALGNNNNNIIGNGHSNEDAPPGDTNTTPTAMKVLPQETPMPTPTVLPMKMKWTRKHPLTTQQMLPPTILPIPL